MRIVFIDKENQGGIHIYNHRLINFLKSKNHEVTVIRFGNKSQTTDDVIFIPQHFDHEQSTVFIFLPSRKTLKIIERNLRSIQPDVVYTCIGLSPFDFFLPALCHKLRVPLAAVWHGDLNTSVDLYHIMYLGIFSFYLPFCQQVDMLHVFSHKLKEFYTHKGVPEKKIAVIPNGVNTKIYSPGTSCFAKKHGMKKGLLFLGRVSFQKNPEVLITSFLACNPAPSVKLVIVGTGDLEKKLRRKYQDERIIFTGGIYDEKEKVDIMRACQIFVLPSRFEGASLALLEAMSCGLASIVSDAGSNVEVVGKTGIVIPVHSIKKQLAAAIHDLLTHPAKTTLLGKQSRAKMIAQYSEEKVFTSLLSRFQQLTT